MPTGDTTRPTSDRAREGMFSSLQSLVDLDGARVLDLYAGSGALGLEALSRGAAGATLVDDAPAAVAVLRANTGALALPADVVQSTVARFLARPPSPYDLVLLDPPYSEPVEEVLGLLPPWVAGDGVVVLERAARGPAPTWPEGLVELRARRYGEAVLRYAARP